MKTLGPQMLYVRQKGMATLLTAVVLLIAVLGVTFIMSDVIIREKQLVANEYRAQQAFQAAQGGLDYAIAYLSEGTDHDNDGNIDTLDPADLGVGRYEASIAEINLPDDNSMIYVYAKGYSDDSAVQRNLSQAFAYLPILPNPPKAPVVARGSVSTTGNLSVTNNVENFNIWTGEDVSAWGDANTFIKVDNVPDQLSTTKNTKGPDVVDGDQNLANLKDPVNATGVDPGDDEYVPYRDGDGLLANFFDLHWYQLYHQASRYDLPANPEDAAGVIFLTNDNYDDSDGQESPVEVSINGGVYGSKSPYKPVILVVDGDLTITGNMEFNGLIVARNLIKGAGNPEINGGIIATNDIDFGAGKFTVEYHAIDGDGGNGLNVLGPINGSWKDWE